MIIAERHNLSPVKVLISNSLVHLELFEDSQKNLFLSSILSHPEGIVYYATTSSLLCEFAEGSITLQALFDRTPSLFVEIISETKTALYSLNDIDVDLKYGDKTIQELSRIEVTKV
ncbi:MAG TPA: hypothetical protein VFW07_11610 [Parafilimonas sp.]|nr:hypothetical protein [Parafilimonas sp.]